MKLVYLGVLLFVYNLILAQMGSVFPMVKGHTLDDKNLVIPELNGKYSVVAIAFNRDAEDLLKQWLNPLYGAFIKKEKGESQFDIAELFDVNFVFIPLISGFKRIEADFKSNTDKGFWPYIMDTEKTDIKEVQKALGIENTKIPYFYILDKAGKIVASQSGKYSEVKLDVLEEAIE